MNHAPLIRQEQPADYAQVETLIRRAFWNLYIPGCVEHYLARTIRPHPDFLPELDLVLELDGEVIGSIMYTKARLVEDSGAETPILTFGPVCIAPEHRHRGYGKLLMEQSFQMATEMGYKAIVIFGDPANYVARGFVSCKRKNICLEDGSFPAAMLVKELLPGVLDGQKRVYRQSPAFEIDEAAAQAYDSTLEPWEKKVLPQQESFYIMSHATLQ